MPVRTTKARTAALVAVALPVVLLAPAAAGAAADSVLHVTGATVEHQAHPLGIDVAKPRLGWTLRATEPGAVQTAYEVEVSTAGAASSKVWDSGRVRSPRSFDVPYGGPALASQTRYLWRVRVWDGGGHASGWSKPAWFETAFLDPAQFAGDWIEPPATATTTNLSGANWIWYPEGNAADSVPAATRYFRRTFDVAAGSRPTSAQLQITADDKFTVYVNGTQVASSPQVTDSWRTATIVDIAAQLHAGSNSVAVSAVNAAAGPAGLLARLDVDNPTGSETIVTDGSWKSSDTQAEGWQQPGFDDSTWPQAQVAAAYGSGPWGSSVTAPTPAEPLLRRTFDVARHVKSARVYIAGLGYYKLYLNGGQVGDHQLDPGFTVYDKTNLYSTYDVTDALQAGENAVGVSLGRGYYSMLNPDEWVSSPWHGDPKLKLELDITYADGSTQRIVSDPAWKSAEGPTRTESLWFGETYDARQDHAGWTSPGYDDSGWSATRSVAGPGGVLHAEDFPPIKVTGKLPVVSHTSPRDGVDVYDVGTPTAGWARVGLSGPAGSTVTITYGEKLNTDGTVNNAGAFGMALQVYTVTLKGDGVEYYQPSYSYAGYQYVQVATPSGVHIASITPERVHSAVATTGNFTSSSSLLNRYHQAEANTVLNNLASVPTDTPMYEKRPYTGDGHLYANAAINSFDMENFYENWMRTHRDDQNPDGAIGQTVPGTPGAKAVEDPVWGASLVLINWDLYWYYGDRQALADNYRAMQAWMAHFENQITPTGYVFTGFSYGDWLSPEGAQEPEGTRLSATAYLEYTATEMGKIANALGHGDDAEHYRDLADKITNGFNTAFYDAASGSYHDDKSAGYRQTSNLLPLAFGMVPKADRKTVVANLLADIDSRGFHLDTGALGTKIILPVLTDTGNADVAYKIATNPTYPGWGYWFDGLGASTMWEEWNANSRSHDHAFMGTVDDWLFDRVAGIEPAGPAYSKITFQPYPGDLTHASAQVSSPLGRVSSAWTDRDGRFTLHISVPVGATATVRVPATATSHLGATPAGATFDGLANGYAQFAVGSGRYTFTATAR